MIPSWNFTYNFFGLVVDSRRYMELKNYKDQERTSFLKGKNRSSELILFSSIYDQYSPKAFGFICMYATSNKEAEEYLIKVFLKVWDGIVYYHQLNHKKFLSTLIHVCRPIIRRSKIAI